MVLETDDKKYESKKENFNRRSSFPMRSENPKRYSTTLSLQILESVNNRCGGLQSKSLPESIPTKEFTISRSPTKLSTAKIESGYSELPSPSRIIKSATFTVQAMEIVNVIPPLKKPELQPDEPPDPKKDEEDRNKSPERTSEKQRKNEIENIPIKISPSPSETVYEAIEEDAQKTNEADVNICESNAESASAEENLKMQQPLTEVLAVTTPVKNGKGKFGGLKKRKSLDKSSRKNSLPKETTGDVLSPPSLSSAPAVIITPSHNGRKTSTSPSLSLPLSLPSQEDGNSSISNIVEYEGGKKTPKKADVETMRAMGLTEERKPKLSSRASFKMWKRSALQYIKSHASNVRNGKMYRMNPDAQIKKDDLQHYKNETPDAQQHISANGNNQLSLCSDNPDANNDLSPTEAYKNNCSPMYKCYPINTSPYSDEKTRKWRRVRRAFSELYPSRCIDPKISDDEPNNRKSEQKALHRKSLLSMSKTNSQFDLRTLGAIEIDTGSLMSDSFNSELLLLQDPDKNKDYSESSGKKSSNDKSKSDKNSVCETTSESEVTSKSNLPSLPLKSNGLYQTAPHRIDFQKYVIDPNRENYRRSSIADIPTANSSAENSHATQKEQHSKSLESSRTESQLKKETASPKKEKAASEKNVPKEEFSSVSRESSCSTFQLINISPDSSSTSTSTTSASTTNTSTSQDVSSFPTSQLSSCTTSNNLTTSTSSSTTTSSDDATVSPTFEEYAKAHGGMNFAVGLAVYGGRPAKDNQTTSRGVTANLTQTQGMARRGSVTIANKATSPMSSEMGKENVLLDEEATLNKKLHTEEPQNVSGSSVPEGFRRTQEISCRLLNPDQATATRNTYLIPSKSVSPGSVTTRYPRKDAEMASEKTDSNTHSALCPAQKSESDERMSKIEPESEKYSLEDISKVIDTSISDSNTIINDQEPLPVPPPRRRLKENFEGTPTVSPSILKKPNLASSRYQSPVIQEGKGKEKKESDSPSLTKIPTSRKNISNQDTHTGSCEKSVSPFKVRKMTKPVSPLPKRNFSPKPMRASKSMPSSPDLNAGRDLRIAGGLPSSPESTPKRTTRTTSHIPSSPEISNKISRSSADKQPSLEPGSPKRSRLATEKTTNSDKKNESPAKDPDAEGASISTKTSSNRIPFSEAAPLKNSRMTTTSKQVNPDTGVTKNNRVLTPKRVNVNTGLQVVPLSAPAKAISTDPSKNSRIPVCKTTRPDVIPKKSGRLAMNRLMNPHIPTEKCLKATKTSRPASAHVKYSQPHSEETRIPFSPGNLSERHELSKTMSCDLETGSPSHQETIKPSLSNSTRSVCKDLERDITSHEAKLSPISDSLFKLPMNASEKERGEMVKEHGAGIFEISREEISEARKKMLLVKTISCEAESGSPTKSPPKLLVQQKAGSSHPLVTKEKGEESPFSTGEVKKQDAAAQTTSDEVGQKIGKVVTTGSALLSTLKQDMAAQTNENELQTAACGIVPIPIVTRQTPHQIKMGGAALRARANTEPPDVNGTKHMSRTLDHRWEVPGYPEHLQQLMVVEEGQARLYDLKPAFCQSVQLLSPSEYSLGSATSTEHSGSPDPYIIESASMDRCLGSLANSRYRYNLSNSMAGGLDAIAQNNTEQNVFESSGSFKDGNLENIPRRRRAASLSNIEFPGKANDKKNRKRSRLSTFFDIFQRKKKPTLISDDVDLPTHFRVIGRILEMCLDGTRIIELTQPPHGLCGIYMTRVKHSYGYGIYVSRFCDGYPAKMFAGLLAIGDQILEINGVPTDKMTVEEAHDMVASRDTLILRVMPDPNNYRVSTLPR